MNRPVTCRVEKDHILICVQTEDNLEFPCIRLSIGSTWNLQFALEKAVKEAIKYRDNQKFKWNPL